MKQMNLDRKEYFHPTRNEETISIASDLNASCNGGTIVLNSRTTKMWMNRNGQKGGMPSSLPPSKLPEITVVNTTTFASARDNINQQRQTNAESNNST